MDDVVKLYGLQRITVYSHIAQLYSEGKLKDYYLYIEDYELHTVRNTWLIKSRTSELKIIFEALSGAVEYGKIRLALAIISKEENI